jgi:hypothetical protein
VAILDRVLTSNGYILDESSSRLGELVAVPDHERRSRTALRHRLTEHGYLYLPGQIDPDIVLAFREYYFASLTDVGLLRTGTDPIEGIAGPDSGLDRAELRHRLFKTIVPGAAYQVLCSTPQIKGWFSWFLDGEVHLHRRKIIRHTRPDEHTGPTRGVGTATQAHYDLVYLREGTDQVLSMWIPLGTCPRTVGGLIYLENSHLWAQQDERSQRPKRPAAWITADLPGLADQHDARWLWADYNVGDVVVHTAFTVHAALDNVDPTGRMRLSTDIRYQLASEQIDQRWQADWHDRDGL